MASGSRGVRLQNLKNQTEALKQLIRLPTSVPKELANKTDFFAQQELINLRVLEVIEKIQGVLGE